MYSQYQQAKPSLPIRQITIAASVFIALIFALFFITNYWENVDSEEIVVMQDPIDGELHVHRTAGLKTQAFASNTRYEKSYQLDFEGVPIRFNDKGKAAVSGTMRWKMPANDEAVRKLHELYGAKGGEDAIEEELIRPVIERAIYLTGSHMSSTESAASRRPELLGFIMDQARFGEYRTRANETKAIDPITGLETTVRVLELVEDPNSPGGYARLEPSPVEEFGIELSNFSIGEVDYDDAVDAQINSQRELEMQIERSIAAARTAEQEALTAEANGQAAAAQARWAQEVLKATAVTEAEQKKAVAELDYQTAQLERRAKEERAQGEATAARLVMQADGALTQKLNALVQMNKDQWNAIAASKNPFTPLINNSGSGGSTGATDLISLLTLDQVKKLQKELGVNN